MADFSPIHPGEALRHDFLEPLGMSQYALAKALAVPEMRISELVNRKRAVTPDTAHRGRGAPARGVTRRSEELGSPARPPAFCGVWGHLFTPESKPLGRGEDNLPHIFHSSIREADNEGECAAGQASAYGPGGNGLP